MSKKSDSSDKIEISINRVIINPQTDLSSIGAGYIIDSVKLNKDILSIFVNYSGGCKEHIFELYSNGKYAKSLPAQMTLCLRHTNNDDNCRMLLLREYKFNIAQLKNSNYETIVLNIGDKTINYNFK